MKIWTDKRYPIILSCAKCLAPWVEREVKNGEHLNYKIIDSSDNVVVVEGNIRDVFKLNLYLRTAHRVLVPLLRATCKHIRELYDLVGSLDWENQLEPDGYFSVSSIVHNDTVRDTRLPSLVTKDAIADRMRLKCGRRPDSGSDYDRGADIFIHWEKNRLIVYLDTSGSPLSKRGYRKIPGSAPMQETLAAACIDALGWDRKTPFISPMCGSGTPAIEAALAAIGRAPGSLRSHFAFMSLKGYRQIIPNEKAPMIAPRQRFGATPEQIWKETVLQAAANENTTNLPKIVATDISPEAIENAKTNAYAAGVSQFIQFNACDFGDTFIPQESVASYSDYFNNPTSSTNEESTPILVPDNNSSSVSQINKNNKKFNPRNKREEWHYKGCVFFNPEYGIRLGDPAELVPIYERIGTFMHDKCAGFMGGLITGNPELSKMVNLFYSDRVPFYNGPIDCRLFLYPNCEIKGENKPSVSLKTITTPNKTQTLPEEDDIF